jgi:hypothetical protein
LAKRIAVRRDDPNEFLKSRAYDFHRLSFSVAPKFGDIEQTMGFSVYEGELVLLVAGFPNDCLPPIAVESGFFWTWFRLPPRVSTNSRKKQFFFSWVRGRTWGINERGRRQERDEDSFDNLAHG